MAQIGNTGLFGLAHRNPHEDYGVGGELGSKPFVNETGDIFRGGVLVSEGRVLVKIPMVKLGEDLFEISFQVFEVYEDTYFVQLFSLDGDLYLPVVPVGPFTRPRIVTQKVGGGEFVPYGELKHRNRKTWRRRGDSNPGITILQTVALTAWLRRLFILVAAQGLEPRTLRI